MESRNGGVPLNSQLRHHQWHLPTRRSASSPGRAYCSTWIRNAPRNGVIIVKLMDTPVPLCRRPENSTCQTGGRFFRQFLPQSHWLNPRGRSFEGTRGTREISTIAKSKGKCEISFESFL